MAVSPLSTDGESMDGPVPVFLAERAAPEMTDREFRAVHSALARASNRVRGAGPSVRYVRSTYDRSRGLWVATFTADDPNAVVRAIDLAQLPPVVLTEAVELWTSDVPR